MALLSNSTLSPSTIGNPRRLLSKPPLAKRGDTTDLPAGMPRVVSAQGVKPASTTSNAAPTLLNTAPSPGASVMPGWLHASVNVLASHLPVMALNLDNMLPLGALGKMSETRLPPLDIGLATSEYPDGTVSVT